MAIKDTVLANNKRLSPGERRSLRRRWIAAIG